MDSSTFLSMAITLFLIIDPIGGTPTLLALTKNYDIPTQRKIIFRELIFAFLLALFFQYLGNYFLNMIQIQDYVLRIAGGTLLVLVAIEMIFALSMNTANVTTSQPKQEPFIFPIATPLLSGPGLLTTIMVFSRQAPPLTITAAITCAWVVVTIVFTLAPFLQKILKNVGLTVLEQVMGMTLALVSIDMIVRGVEGFIGLMRN